MTLYAILLYFNFFLVLKVKVVMIMIKITFILKNAKRSMKGNYYFIKGRYEKKVGDPCIKLFRDILFY